MEVHIAWCVCLNLLHIIVMCRKLHAYRSLHACLLPPDIQSLPPQSTSCGSIKSSEHYFDTSGNDGEGPLQTHVQSLVTNRQQCVPKLYMWFSVHVFMSA